MSVKSASPVGCPNREYIPALIWLAVKSASLFSHVAPMQAGNNLEALAKVADFAENINAGLYFGGDSAMTHTSLSFLILLCLFADSQYIERLCSSMFFLN
jgi:hypothetical protein